jgi:WD40 repeat protein
VQCVAFAPDNSHVASGNQRGEVLLHPLRAEEVKAVLSHGDNRTGQEPGGVLTLQYWPAAPTTLLAGYEDGVVRAWDVEGEVCTSRHERQHQGQVTGVAGSPTNEKLAASTGSDRRLVLFDVREQKYLKDFRALAGMTGLVSVQLHHHAGGMS